jgi:hypothetical protein
VLDVAMSDTVRLGSDCLAVVKKGIAVVTFQSVGRRKRLLVEQEVPAVAVEAVQGRRCVCKVTSKMRRKRFARAVVAVGTDSVRLGLQLSQTEHRWRWCFDKRTD